MTNVPSVLFVCVHNAGRSQMAAALLNHHGAGRVEVRSAGSVPAERSTPRCARRWPSAASTSSRVPKPLTADAVQAADVVITMGCGDACPVFPGKRYLDWELDDPAGQAPTRCGRSATTSTPGPRATRRAGRCHIATRRDDSLGSLSAVRLCPQRRQVPDGRRIRTRSSPQTRWC